MPDTKDFGLNIRVFNNQLKSRLLASGLRMYELCDRIGISMQTWCRLVSLRVSAVGARGWRPSALKIADYFGELPEELFPRAGQEFKQRVSTIYFDADDVAMLATDGVRGYLPIDEVEVNERKEAVRDILASLTPREEKILRMRFGFGVEDEHTIEEVGEFFDVSRERVRQIEGKSLRKLRHPARAKYIKSHWEKGKPWTP